MLRVLNCQHCGGEMRKGRVRGWVPWLLSWLIVGVGILISLSLLVGNIFAIILGPLFILLGWWIGTARRVWRCRSCGAIVPRA